MTHRLVCDLSAVGHGDAAAGLLGDGPAAAARRLARVPRQALLHVTRLALVLPLRRATLLQNSRHRFITVYESTCEETITICCRE